MKRKIIILIILLFSLSLFANNGFLGIIVNDKVPSDLKMRFGVIVLKTVKNSPADKAKIESGDIILEINGKKIISDIDIADIVRTKKVGDPLSIVLLKKNNFVKKIILELDDPQKYTLTSFYYNNPIHFYLNVNYISVNPQLQKFFHTNSGIFVTEVFNTKKENLLQAGDIILEINGYSVNSGNDFFTAIKGLSSKQKSLNALIKRDKKEISAKIKIDNTFNYYSFDYKKNSILLKKNGNLIKSYNYLEMRNLINEIDIDISQQKITNKILELEKQLKNIKDKME